jgi:hypothetical protein
MEILHHCQVFFIFVTFGPIRFAGAMNYPAASGGPYGLRPVPPQAGLENAPESS